MFVRSTLPAPAAFAAAAPADAQDTVMIAAEAQLSQNLAGGGAQLASLNVSRAAY